MVWKARVGSVEAVPLAKMPTYHRLSPNPSIERTRPGKPGRAYHVKR